jgi:hypothetical protein
MLHVRIVQSQQMSFCESGAMRHLQAKPMSGRALLDARDISCKEGKRLL